MPLYHFNLMAGVPRLLDPMGTYLPDDEAARRHAEELARGQLVQGLKWSIEVISENGNVVDIVEPPGKNMVSGEPDHTVQNRTKSSKRIET
jgi:hypothetical protein